MEKDLIFISHANPEDNEFSAWLASKLKTVGYNAWLDIEDIPVGTAFNSHLQSKIKKDSRLFIAVNSVAYAEKSNDQDKGVAQELNCAKTVNMNDEYGHHFIIPIRINNLDYDDFPYHIQGRKAISFNNNWDAGFAKLIQEFEKLKIPKPLQKKEGDNTFISLTEKDISLLEKVQKEMESLKDKNQKQQDKLVQIKSLLEEMKTIKNDNKLRHNLPVRPYFFLGRKAMLKEIHTYLSHPDERQNILLLSAIGGMGKTTLMQEYLYRAECQDYFQNIIYVFVNNNLQSAFVSTVAGAFALDLKVHPKSEDQLAIVKNELLSQTEKTLVVIDNINEEDRDDLINMTNHFEDTNVKYLITTRTVPDGYNILQVPELSPTDAMLLFAYHYTTQQISVDIEKSLTNYIQKTDYKSDIKNLLEHILRHTLLIELTAKAANKKGISPSKVLEALKEQDFRNPTLQRTINIGTHAKNKQLTKQTLRNYILSIFETDYLRDAQEDTEEAKRATMLRFFSVLPAQEIPIKDLKILWAVEKSLENEFEDRLDDIKQIGWIQGKQELMQTQDFVQNWYYKMHPLVQEVIYEKLTPNIDNVRPLVVTITGVLGKPLNESTEFRPYAKSVIDKLNLLNQK